MLTLHHVVDERRWGFICHTCGHRGIAHREISAAYPDLRWRILDQRAANLVRTGRLSAWLPRVTWDHRSKHTRDADRGDYTDNPGVMLVLVAHHHRRGLSIPVTDGLWDAAVTMAALGGPWAGARLLLEAATPTN